MRIANKRGGHLSRRAAGPAPTSRPRGAGPTARPDLKVLVVIGEKDLILPPPNGHFQVARFAGPNLIIGNTILLKHAAQCPESAAAIQQIFLDAGFPAGASSNHPSVAWRYWRTRRTSPSSVSGTMAAAAFHVSRTVCRRAERRCVELHHAEPVGETWLSLLNRLSDLLFVLARVENHRAGKGDVEWQGIER